MRARDDAVLIVGGGPAGLATALELAHQHIAAMVVERSAYNDLRIGEHLTPPGVLDSGRSIPPFLGRRVFMARARASLHIGVLKRPITPTIFCTQVNMD